MQEQQAEHKKEPNKMTTASAEAFQKRARRSSPASTQEQQKEHEKEAD
jgi:hypothetical protein